MSDERCDWCGRRWDRPCPTCQHADRHATPDLAQFIVEDVEKELNGRRGLHWSNIDDEILDKLRDDLASLVRRRLMSPEIMR